MWLSFLTTPSTATSSDFVDCHTGVSPVTDQLLRTKFSGATALLTTLLFKLWRQNYNAEQYCYHLP